MWRLSTACNITVAVVNGTYAAVKPPHSLIVVTGSCWSNARQGSYFAFVPICTAFVLEVAILVWSLWILRENQLKLPNKYYQSNRGFFRFTGMLLLLDGGVCAAVIANHVYALSTDIKHNALHWDLIAVEAHLLFGVYGFLLALNVLFHDSDAVAMETAQI